MKKNTLGKISSTMVLLVTALSSANAQWQWSNGLQTYYYRDNNGVVHYGDGSSGGQSSTWTSSDGKTVYSANSAGPSDKTGTYAVQAARIDESSVGAAPTSPPENAVAVNPGSTGGPVFGGTDPNRTVYITPIVSCSEASMGGTNYQLCNIGQSQANTKYPVQVGNSAVINPKSSALGQVANAVVVGNSSTSSRADLGAIISQIRAANPINDTVTAAGAASTIESGQATEPLTVKTKNLAIWCTRDC